MRNINHPSPAQRHPAHSFGFVASPQYNRTSRTLRDSVMSLPPQSQTCGIATRQMTSRYDAPVRSLLDIVQDPVQWLVSYRLDKIVTIAGFGLISMALIF